MKDIHAVRKIKRISREEFSDVEEYLEYLAEDEYSLSWAEVRSDKLFPYERRTIAKLLKEHNIPDRYCQLLVIFSSNIFN